MPLTLTFTDTDELLIAALHKRARANGRSIEDEHRDILRSVLRPLPQRTAPFAAAAAGRSAARHARCGV